MIVITGFLNCSSDHLKNLIFDSIEVNIIKVGPMAFSVFLVGYDTYGIKYHFSKLILGLSNTISNQKILFFDNRFNIMGM
jgi:hypothetical protein